MVWAIVVFFMLIAAGLLWKRRQVADMQSLMGGARVAPGCVVVEALFVLLLAAIAVWMHARGWLGF